MYVLCLVIAVVFVLTLCNTLALKDMRGWGENRGEALRRHEARHVRGGQQAILQLQP
jgi:hypothetical protein